MFEFLPVLERLKPEHLRTFFRRINLQLRVDQQQQENAIRIIMESTQGEYDLVVRELEVLIQDGYSKFAEIETEMDQPAEIDDFDY